MTAFRWTKYRLALKSMLTEHGSTVEELEEFVESAQKTAAAQQGWRKSELACSIASSRREIREVARRCGVLKEGDSDR